MRNKPNVLYLSYDGLTDPLGQSQILPYVIGLSEHYAFTIISFEKDERFATGQKGIQSLCDRHNIRWVPLRYHKTPPVFSTLYDVWKLRRTSAALHKIHDFKIVHCRSYITALVGLWMKRTLGVKFIFDMRGFWADERVEGGLWNLNNPVFKTVYNFFKRQEQKFFREADHVVSLTRNAQQEIQSWGIATGITVIPCCVDLDHFDPVKVSNEQKAELRKELGFGNDDFVLLYLGSLGTWYLVNEMLDFFSELKKKKINARFLVVTPDKLELSSYAYASDVTVRPATRQQVPLLISIAQASLVFIKPSFSKKASSATKMAEIMAMNVPVVVNVGWGDVADIHDPAQVALVDFAEPLIDPVNRTCSFKPDAGNRIFAEANYSIQLGVKRYASIYKSLLHA